MSILKGQMETHEGDILYPKTSFDMVEGVPNLASPNLLINSDFKSGIINQKGQTLYDVVEWDNIYTIDMWSKTSKAKVTVSDGYIKVEGTNANGYSYFKQPLSNPLNENCLVAVKTKTVVGNAKIYIEGLSINSGVTITSNDIFTCTSENAKSVFIEVGKIGSVEIEFIKLEKGSAFTGMPVWNEAIELLKCMKKFQVYEGDFISNSASESTYWGCQLPVKMDKKPISTVDSIRKSDYTDVKSNVSEIHCSESKMHFVKLSANYSNSQILTYTKIFLDAYDY